MKKTPLHARHVELGAKMIPFAGYSMPVQYSGILSEHLAVRRAAGLFDVSHMGNLVISGPLAEDFVQRVTVNNSALKPLQVQYSAMCNHRGGVVDDILVTKIKQGEFHLVVNAANVDKDYAWLCAQASRGVEILNRTAEVAILALQGPGSVEIMKALNLISLLELGSYKAARALVEGEEILISRTGYTGEDGFEFFPSSRNAPAIWDALMKGGREIGLLPCGLGARDTLRLEAGYTLYGHEVDEETNPIEGGLAWIVDFEKGDFIGRQALEKYTGTRRRRKIVGLELVEKAIPRQGQKIFKDGREVGWVTSGTLSPYFGRGIALANLDITAAQRGVEVVIEIRESLKRARVNSRYFYRRPKTQSRREMVSGS